MKSSPIASSRPVIALALTLPILVSCAAEETLPDPPTGAGTSGFSTNPYCPEGVVLCSELPGEEIQVPPGCESFDQQCSRDFWSWQNFVSLNWPGEISSDGSVMPNPDASVGDGGQRVWELWMDPDSIFLPGAQKPGWTPGTPPPSACDLDGGGAKPLVGRLAKASVAFDVLDPDDFFEATVEQPLIDQDLNFVVFEIRMNEPELNWIVTNSLYQQETIEGLTESLEMPADVIEMKAAWRIIPDDMPSSQKDRYYRRKAIIALSPQHVEGGGSDTVCLERELGLIGLHLRHNGLWSTFEQVDNVTASGGVSPTLFNPSCTTCTENVAPTDKDGNPIPPADYKWSLDGPSASLYEGFPNVPSQITYAPGQTEWINKDLNSWWQGSVLQGTVWEHYMLITTNWLEFPQSSQPVPTLNTSLEAYIPTDTQVPQACIDCHKLAVNKNKAELAESFVLFRACPEDSTGADSLPPNCTPGGVDNLAARD